MNNKKLFLISLILILFTAVTIIVIIQNSSHDIKSFEFSDYQYYIDNFSSEENVGNITDSKDVVEKAEKIWIKLYGEDIKKEKPYHLFYDDQNEVWLIQGNLKSNMKGGVANILIENRTGNVLAVWHDK